MSIITMTQTHRPPLISPTAGLRLLWGVIRFLLVAYTFMFRKAAKSLRARPGSRTPENRPA
jgi:hypothetical protein